MCKYFIFYFLFLLLPINSFALEKVSLQLQWLNQFQFAGYYMAKEKGFYTDVGLAVNIKPYKQNISTTNEVIIGNSEYAIGRSSIFIDMSEGKELLALAAVFQSTPLILLSKKDSNINTINDFKNKRIMLADGALGNSSLRAMIESKNMDFLQTKVVKHSLNIDDLISGKIDLMAAYSSNEPYILKKNNIDYTIFSPKDYGFDFYGDLLFTSQKEYKNHPIRVRKFTEASLKGWVYAFKHIDETVNLIFSKYNEQNKSKDELDFEARQLRKLAFSNNKNIGDINKDKVSKIFDIYKVLGLTKNEIDFNSIIYRKDKLDLNKEEKSYLLNKKEILACVEGNRMPFSGYENFKNIGMVPDYLDLFSKKLNIPIRIINTKSEHESYYFLNEKLCDILPSTAKTSINKNHYFYTEEYMSSPMVIATSENKNYVSSLDELSNKKIAVIEKNGFLNKINEYDLKMDIIKYDNIDEALADIQKNKIFGLVDSLYTISYIINKKDFHDIKIAGKLNDLWNLRVMTTTDNIELVEVFNKLVTSISLDEHNNIKNKWSTIRFEKGFDYTYLYKYVLPSITLLILLLLYLWNLNLRNSIRKRDEISNELNTSLLNHKHLVNSTIESLFFLDEEYTCIDLNHSSVNLFNAKDKFVLLGKNFFDLVSSDSFDIIKKNADLNLNEPFEVTLITKHGKYFPAIVKLKTNLINNKVARIISIIDLSELKKKDEMLKEQSVLAQMGEMISMIAHQWRQPLGAISATAIKLKVKIELKKYDLDSKKGQIEHLNFLDNTFSNIESYVQNLSSTIDDFRNFFNNNKKHELCVIKKSIDQALSILELTISSKGIDVYYNLNSKIKKELLNNELMQVIINLLKNAIDNFDDKKINNPKIWINTYDLDNNIVLEIIDNGKGIAETNIGKIFDAYFSTKGNHGTGLGLYMSKMIIEKNHNGKINVSCENDVTTFKIVL